MGSEEDKEEGCVGAVAGMSGKKGLVQDLRGRRVPRWWGGWEGPGRGRKKELLENEDSGMDLDSSLQLEDLCD